MPKVYSRATLQALRITRLTCQRIQQIYEQYQLQIIHKSQKALRLKQSYSTNEQLKSLHGQVLII